MAVRFPIPGMEHNLVNRSGSYSLITDSNFTSRSAISLSRFRICRRTVVSTKEEVIPFDSNACNLFFNPVPRRSPLQSGWMWPSKMITDALFEAGFVRGVSTCLVRSKSIEKSAFIKRGEPRPLPRNHYDTLSLNPTIINSENITLVDDIVTRGATLLGCAGRLTEAYPEKHIRSFAVIRTQSDGELESILDPECGFIKHNEGTGRIIREP